MNIIPTLELEMLHMSPGNIANHGNNFIDLIGYCIPNLETFSPMFPSLRIQYAIHQQGSKIFVSFSCLARLL